MHPPRAHPTDGTLKDGLVAIARVGGHALFQARFQLVGTPIL